MFEHDLFAKTGSRLFRIILCQYRSLQVTIDATSGAAHRAFADNGVSSLLSPIGRSPADAVLLNGSMMKDDGKNQRHSGKAKDLRHERLKQALRENLKRRKSQGRGREDYTTPSPNSDDVASEETGKTRPGK